MTFNSTSARPTQAVPVVLVFLCCLAPALLGNATESGPLSVEDAVRVREFGSYSPPKFTSDGRYLAYVVVDRKQPSSSAGLTWALSGVPWYAFGASIFVADTDTGVSLKVTEDDSDNWLPTWSPDGRYLAFLSDHGDGYARLWIWNRANHKVRRVCDTKVNTAQMEWTSDSQGVLLTTPPTQKPAAALTISDSLPLRSVMASDNRDAGPGVIVYKAGVASDGNREIAQADPWNLDEALHDLVLIAVDTGRGNTILQGNRVASFTLSPDDSTVAYTVPKGFEKAGSQQILYDVSLALIQRGTRQVLASNVRLDFNALSFSWSPDSRHLSFRTGGVEEKFNDCYVADVKDGALTNISRFPAPSAGVPHRALRPLWAADAKHVYFVRDGVLWIGPVGGGLAAQVAQVPQHRIIQLISVSRNLLWTPSGKNSTIVLAHDEVGLQDALYKVDLNSGQATKMLEQGQCYSCVAQNEYVAVSRDGTHAAYFAEDAQHHPELWTMSREFERPRRLTHLAPEFDKYKLGSVQLIDWLSDDGERLRGALLLPVNYELGTQYPLITYVYGGTSLSAFADRFGLGYGGPFNMQLLATRGYAVLLPDSPQNQGTPVLDLVKTVLPGINRIIEIGVADPERLGIIGHSNGGYDTLALITHTKRFKAAVEMDGMGDLLSLYGAMGEDGAAYGTSNVERGQNGLGGTPWEVRDAYIENSPFFYLDRVETPLLIVQGGKDETVPPFLADQVFVSLRRLGKKVEYAKYPNEGHFPPVWSEANQLDLSTRMIRWLDQYLRK